MNGQSRLPLGAVLAFSAPTIGMGYLLFLVQIYFFKYAADVLLIAPAAMGTVFLAARVWDAVSDPLAGYLSDRTRSSWGRRRPWLLASALPIALVPVMAWVPPGGLSAAALVLWVAVGLLLLETALTAFAVPHSALGAELSMDHHERTRVFAFRHVGVYIGFFLAIGGMQLLIEAEDKRSMALWVSGIGGALSAVLILVSTLRLRERQEHRDRGARRPLPAFLDVVRNPHARLLLIVFLIESMGNATLAVLGPFYLQYVIGDETKFMFLLFAYSLPSLLFVPIGLPLSRRFGKKRVWALSMALTGLSFGAFFFGGPGTIVWVCLCGIGAGIGNAIGAMVGPSVQADVIDYDEYQTGERKEGTYFATWNFVRKAATGIMGFLTGIALQLVGFEPNAEQTEATRLAIRALFGLVPGFSFAVGVTLFLRFRLTEEEHARVRAELDARLVAGRGD